MATTPDAAFETLMNGVTNWDLPKEFIPNELLLTGETTFPVMVNDKGQVLIAASSYGQGRLVVISHERYLLHAGLAPFLFNAVRWLCPSPEAPILVHPSLASLVNILSDSGLKALVQPEPGETLGVYCTDAYNDTLTDRLVQFVKRGGGLLIGGQAYYWASQHGSDKVLSNFPGNHVTSVAGVYFTDVCGSRDSFEVSKEIPNPTLYVKCEDEIKYDQQQLLEGMSVMDIETQAVPCQLLVHGQRAFPLGVDNSFNCFLAAARYGHGRVVLGGHESLMLSEAMLPFVLNALHWLMGPQTGRVGLASKMKALKSLLPNSSFQWSETEHLTGDLSVFCCCSFTNIDPKKVEEFVAEGGGLLIGAGARLWGHKNPDSDCMTQYPNNITLKCFGLGITSQVVKKGSFPVPNPQVIDYHIRKALAQFESAVYSQNCILQERWLMKLVKDCSYMLQMTHQRISIYDSVKERALKVIQHEGFPRVSDEHPILKGSPQAFLLFLAYELFKSGVDASQLLPPPSLLPPTESPMVIKINNRSSWVSTGLYLPEGQVAQITLPTEATNANLKVLIGCHTDNIGEAKTYYRPPVMTYIYHLNSPQKNISWLYGGLLYVTVPNKYNRDDVSVTISGAVSAPYFKIGETTQEEWKDLIKSSEAPWGELATDNIILTIPTECLKMLRDPYPLLQLWDEIVQAVAKLAAVPFPFKRPERVVLDKQISLGYLHSGYPVMGHISIAEGIIDEIAIRSHGIWGVAHELGHNQQKGRWNFPPYTTEALCNLWSIYVHETVLNIHRDQAHPSLKPELRMQRIKTHLNMGAPLSNWVVWTALETYLQLQEGFGWEPFIQIFADYRVLSNLPKGNEGKMNLWVKKFSEVVQKNLAPFFEAWGWPVQNDVAESLTYLPEWLENPMKMYTPEVTE
ncbi:TRPM8 channel-associated factor 3-like isoform X2 [Mesocricetus auratus]|uniref:TRPM8 channel-associated factor 3-like isoform X2 n=1 Tax=Mesocricetus auratus TaxID=10036 RepID=A0ABM2X0D4_MESAU|nr:TRPM8 channel-associated factor 3-like isoform X2 [Mesocricetus auratus]